MTGRAAELARVRTTVVRDRRNVVVAGRAGVGKSRLAHEALTQCQAEGLVVARVTATRASSGIPLGAFAPHLPVIGPGTVPVDDRAALLRRCADELLAQAEGTPLVLGVDDAHLLDDASATLVQQMAQAGSVVVATVCSGESAPDPVVALWKNGSAERIELEGLDVAEVTEVLSSTLGGRLDDAAVNDLMARSRGNMLFLRELVIGALSSGVLRDDGGIWRLIGDLHPTDRLVELVEDRLEGLSVDERELMEVIALGEPLGLEELSRLASEALAEQLERKSLVRLCSEGPRTILRLAHPLYSDVIRARMPGLRARAIARSLAESAETAGGCRPEDLLRIATWRLTGGGAEPALMFQAAIAARWRYDFPLAERFARAAVDGGAGFEPAILAAQLASLQGRSAQADKELKALARQATTAAQRGRIVLTRLDNLVIYSGTIDEGLRITQEPGETSVPAGLWDEIVARRAALLLGKQGPRAAVEATTALLERATGRALAWACMPGAYSLARMGRIEEALGAARRGLRVQSELAAPIDWYPFMHAFYQAEALTYAGRFTEAEAVSRARYEEGVADRSLEQQALFSWQLAKPAAERGHISDAIGLAQQAISIYRQLGRPQFVHFCLIYLAQALAVAGRRSEARSALRDLDRLDVGHTYFMGVDLHAARAWVDAAEGNVRHAAERFAAAADEGERIGDLVGALSALHSVARIGHPRRVVGRVEDLAGSVEGELGALRAAHVRALAAQDPRELAAVSASFERMGALLLAAEAAAVGSSCWNRAGDTRKSASVSQRAAALADRCGGAHTPALCAMDLRHELTLAEWETAELASSGLSNKDIAANLMLSVRTVENRLQQVYNKLGIRSRGALGAALGERPEQATLSSG